MRLRHFAAALVAAAALAAPASSNALEFKLFGQPLRLDITESLFSSYHGDLGYLITERDSTGAHPENHFYDILNRLNAVLAWKEFRLAVRIDSAGYFDTPPNSCLPSSMAALRSKFCGYIGDANAQWPQEIYFWPEKAALEYNGREFEATLGDFYISFGRGLVLSLRKLDELGIDTTLQGGRFVLHEGKVGAVLAVGATNINNIDEATGRYAPDPHDLIAAGRVEYRAFDKVIVGLHEVGGIQHNDTLPNLKRHDGMFMYGGSLDAPRLLPWLALYFEGAGQLKTTDDKNETGYALYGSATGYFGPVSVLLEVKHYVHFQRWASSVDPSLPEFAPIVYNQPPTAERIVTELTSPIYDVSGPRLRADWRINAWALLYASYGYFEDRGFSSGTLHYHDPYVGAEFRWNEGRSHLFPSAGFREELCAADNMVCQVNSLNGEWQHIGHLEWDAAQVLPHNLSLEAQGFIYFRRGDGVIGDPANPFPAWTEGDAYFALKWTPHLVFTGGFEWSTRPSPNLNQYFVNGAIQWNITTASSIRFFGGGTRGGLKCISGICRNFPAFTGARLEVVVRL